MKRFKNKLLPGHLLGAAFALAAVVLLLGPVSAGTTGEGDLLLGDFETARPESLETLGKVKVSLAKSDLPKQGGKGYLELTPPENYEDNRRDPDFEDPEIIFKLPEGTDVREFRALEAMVASSQCNDSWKIRWLAYDDQGEEIFQRMQEFDGGVIWTRIEWPLSLWRWANTRIGDWADVKKIGMRIEKGEGLFKIDEVKLLKGMRGKKSAMPPVDWMGRIAFKDEYRKIHRNGFFIATDAVDEISDEDLERLYKQVSPIKDWIKATFPTARRPVGGDQPVGLLIFLEPGDYKNFYRKLGTAWRVSIATPRAGGYTVQDISGSSYDEKKGVDRPVYFHELVHCLATRELRILTGRVESSWLQEGLANYLQLCLYPESIKREDIIRNFQATINRRSFFRPLSELLTRRISGRNYLQLATLTGFLVEKHPEWLDAITKGIADGKPIGEILEGLGTSFDKLQDEWYKWGRKTFSHSVEPPAGPGTHFPVPRQWQKEEDKPDPEKDPEEENKPEEEKKPEKEKGWKF